MSNNTQSENKPANSLRQALLQRNDKENEVTMRDLYYLSLSKWKWYALSVFLCLSLAGIYLLVTPKKFTRTASILIKEESDSKSIGADMARAFGDLGINTTQTNVFNELKMIQSKDLARAVIKRLNLNIDYKTDDFFKKKTLYDKTLPIKVELPGLDENVNVSFDIEFEKGKKLTLSNFKKAGESFDGTVTAEPGYSFVKSPIGRIVILKTANYNNAEESMTIHVKHTALTTAVETMVKIFKGELSDMNATVLDLTYTDVSPKRAEDVIRTYINIYNENWIHDKNQIMLSTSDFIAERLRVIEKELGSVDNNISSYKTRHQITDLHSSSNLYLQKTSEADINILDLNNQLFMARNVRNYLVKSNKFQLLPTNTGIKNANIENQIKEYNNRVLQRNNIVENSSENSPLVIDIDKQLESLRMAMISGIDNEISTLQGQIDSQRQYASINDQKISSTPGQEKFLLSVERQQKVKESLYLFLLQKREENELSQAFTAYNTRVVDEPQGSLSPTAPKPRMVLLLALAMSLFIPFLILYFREALNTSVRSKKDFEDKISVPFLGEIPTYFNNVPKKKWEFWKKDTTPKQLVVRDGSRGIMNEAFRIIGTNIEFVSNPNGEKQNVFMTTSYNAGSGKSFVIGNLGAIFAIKRKKVLIIDGDLRHTTVSNLVNNPSKGLADYLSGREKDVNGLIMPTEQFANLHILPVGTIPPNPTELLATPAFGQLIEEMKRQYDYVFIDCPPADMMADATIISKYADRTLFIIRAGLFERSMLKPLEEAYKTDKFNNLSIILNSTEMLNGHYGYKYGYNYGYKYGYKYGYGAKESSKE